MDVTVRVPEGEPAPSDLCAAPVLMAKLTSSFRGKQYIHGLSAYVHPEKEAIERPKAWQTVLEAFFIPPCTFILYQILIALSQLANS